MTMNWDRTQCVVNRLAWQVLLLNEGVMYNLKFDTLQVCIFCIFILLSTMNATCHTHNHLFPIPTFGNRKSNKFCNCHQKELYICLNINNIQPSLGIGITAFFMWKFSLASDLLGRRLCRRKTSPLTLCWFRWFW